MTNIVKRALLSVLQEGQLVDRLRKLDRNLGKFTHDFNRFSGGEFAPKVYDWVNGCFAYIFVPDNGDMRPEEMYGRAEILAGAAKDIGAEKVVLFAPELHYSRADNSGEGRAVTAKQKAKIFAAIGIDNILTTDIHSDLDLSFYEEAYGKPSEHVVCNIDTSVVFAHHFYNFAKSRNYSSENIVVKISDFGCLKRAMNFIYYMGKLGMEGISYIQFEKERVIPNDPRSIIVKPHSTSKNFTNLEGKCLVSIDDIGDSFGTDIGTSKKSAQLYGIPEEIFCYFSHFIGSGEASSRMNRFGINVITTNSHPNIHYRSQQGIMRTGILDLSSFWFLGMNAIEQDKSITDFVDQYVEDNRVGKLYNVDRKPKIVSLNKEALMNGGI